jgi:hypothetical protein
VTPVPLPLGSRSSSTGTGNTFPLWVDINLRHVRMHKPGSKVPNRKSFLLRQVSSLKDSKRVCVIEPQLKNTYRELLTGFTVGSLGQASEERKGSGMDRESSESKAPEGKRNKDTQQEAEYVRILENPIDKYKRWKTELDRRLQGATS